MRGFAGLLALGLVLIFNSNTQAQEAGDSPNAEIAAGGATQQPPRTPVMVVHEPAVLPQAPKPESAKKPGPSKKGADKAATKPADNTIASAQNAPQTQQPIVIPAAALQHEMATTGNPKYDEFISQSATRNGVDPNLIVAVMRQESGFNPRARSYKGATGLMQLMPATAARFGVVNIYDAQQNIEGGARYLRFLLDTFDGDVSLVLAGYNAGENAVVNSGFRIPRYRETQNYVRSISARYRATGAGRAVSKNPVAPAAATFGAGSSSRLSNNY